MVFRHPLSRPSLLLLLGLGGLSALGGGAAVASESLLSTRYKTPESLQAMDLKSWSLGELQKLKQGTSRERDPITGEIVRWKGVLLSDVVEQALKDLPAKVRADIDLLVLKSTSGGQALIPRAFVVKYPILLAFSREEKPLGDRTPYSVMPWTSKNKIQGEGAPLEAFFLPQVTQIEFTNSKDRFSRFQLKRRTDPAAMRGEKYFVQNCVSCHDTGHAPSISDLSVETKTRSLASVGHPAVKGSPKLDASSKRYLSAYLDAFRSENGAPISAPTAQK